MLNKNGNENSMKFRKKERISISNLTDEEHSVGMEHTGINMKYYVKCMNIESSSWICLRLNLTIVNFATIKSRIFILLESREDYYQLVNILRRFSGKQSSP